MIPKIIHYTWFSGDSFPDKISECVNSWKFWLPDYEFKLWDREAIEGIESQFLAEALKCKKWAYASDYVRLYAVYNYGGIYLDTDVMLCGSFDMLLKNSVFIGREHSIHFEGRRNEKYLTSHCFGAEKGNEFIRRCLDYYTGRKFEVSSDERLPRTLRYNMVLLPYIQSEIAKLYGYDSRPSQDRLQNCDEGLAIYPETYFDALKVSKDTKCVHLAVGSWREYRSAEERITFAYKIRWRWVCLIHKILGKKKYAVLKLN